MNRNQSPSNGRLPADWAGMLLVLLREELAGRHGQARRRLAASAAPDDLLAWAQHFLPHLFHHAPSAMHRWLAQQLDQAAQARGVKINILGPRGSAKSTIASLAYPLRAALGGWEPYIWIVSDTRHQACAHLENLKAELVDNPRLAAAYAQSAGRGPVWRSGTIVLRNGSMIEAFGTGQRIRGRRRRQHRPTLIICDDLQNDSHMQSASQRDHSRTWFHGTLLKAGTGRTNVVNLATALHPDALAMELHRTPGWISRIFRAIQRWPTHMPLWAQWESIYTDLRNPNYREAARAFYEQHRQAMDLGALVLWPEAEDLYALMCMRAESGHAAFEREKQNSPILPEQCEWPETYFGPSLWFDTWPSPARVKVMALDPSKGMDARRGDYSAYVMLAVDAQGLVYVEADLARESTPELVARGTRLVAQFQPHAFGIEANQFQELLAGQFEAEFQRQGVLGVHPWLVHNHVSKPVRIRRLGPYLAGRRLRFKAGSPGTQLLVEQLRQFPAGDHDDGPDALEMALRLAAECFGQGQAEDGLGQRLPVG